MMSQDKQDAIAAARRLMADSDRGALATALCGDKGRGDEGWPYASFVLLAWDDALAPLMFLSGLAEHTRNFLADPRASLMIQAKDADFRADGPLAAERLTLAGRVAAAEDAALRERFFTRHPSTRRLNELGDFRLYRLEIERAHLIAGFGRARWLDRAALIGRNDAAPQYSP